MWLTDNPSEQKMMSGAFYPVDADDASWWNAYKGSEDGKKDAKKG